MSVFSHQKLREALASGLGKTLTPELAAQIEAGAFDWEDYSHDPAKFGSVPYKDYVIQVERFRDILPEMHELHVEHWKETERHRHGLALNPNYDAVIASEKAGKLIQFTMRHKNGELAGNLRMYLVTSIHTQTRYASEDTLYIKPEHRGGFAVMAILKFAQDSLQSIGIHEIRANSKLVNRADVLMRRMGYNPVAIEFVKIFEA
jgi:hypothetical protein